MATDRPTHLGMVGLGRMGSNIARRLMRDGHTCVVHDVAPAAVAALVEEGATGADSLAELVAALPAPRTVWLMLPAGEITERALTEVARSAGAGRRRDRRREHPLRRRPLARRGARARSASTTSTSASPAASSGSSEGSA